MKTCLNCNGELIGKGKYFCGHPCRIQHKSRFRDNLTGQTFGLWKVIKFVGVKRDSRWLCECKCGYQTIKLRSAIRWLKSGDSGCKHCAGVKRRSIEIVPQNVYNRVKRNAVTRNIAFEITKEYITDLLIKQNYKCAYTNIPIKLAETNRSHSHGGSTASLDRIDSNKPYVVGNVHWVHKDIQAMKFDLNENYFVELCSKVYIKQKEKQCCSLNSTFNQEKPLKT